MPANLAHDGRYRERDEIRTGFDVEPGHRVDQADAGYLHQIVARFAAAFETAGDVVGQRQAALDDLVSVTLEVRRLGVKSRQLAEHIGNVGVFIGTRRFGTADSSRFHL